MLNIHQRYCKETYDENGILSKFEAVVPEDYNFAYDVIDEIARQEPDRRAMVWCNDEGEERTFTFGDFKRYSDKAANVLKAHGIGKGDKVMLVLKRHYQYWFAILALHKLGAITIPATHLLTKKDFVYRFNAAGVKAIVCTADGEVSEHVEASLPESPSVEVCFLARGKKDGWVSFDDEVEAASDHFDRVATKSTDTMLGYFTSGTTGYPKLVTHNYSYSVAHILTAKHWQNVKPDGLHFTLSDTGWGKAAWGKLYGQWFMEASIFVCDFTKFTPVELLPLFGKYHITTFCAPPTIYRFFIKEDLSKFDLSSLEYACIAGEALNPEVYTQFYNITGLRLMEGFGQTESTLLAVNTVGMIPKPGSMGKSSPQYDVDIYNEDGTRADNGVVGEICVKVGDGHPYGLFEGYYNNQEMTDRVWHDGLYHTGDTAWRDEDGYLWYDGRTDDIIKSSGYRIGPFEIESALMEHPSVLECAITGVPDPIRGQVVKATIVLAKGYTASEELKKELQNHVKNSTAPYKYPRVVEFVDELPKTISGKIRRVQLRDSDKK
ncbi:AMP-binding protein [Solibaculum mannosilyticum]|uniref:Acetyl-CoA synthetase n=1 Tax=Solibaculum mannosilyticum TaxID=2780922 RepID=A0A7I8D2F6_9FIRM|nr:AMP-binding protein [Solibaculum mannosilyticum]MCO7137037.1 AMP-binding protein [[Clostridium] leptum]BCI60175.1 acetyl-CoA synthetase [Solibaculum mannosilyticum]CZT57956.1 Acetyl-coenzyme A synthetase [Eubacteriaceae bacterium CHKCI005]